MESVKEVRGLSRTFGEYVQFIRGNDTRHTYKRLLKEMGRVVVCV